MTLGCSSRAGGRRRSSASGGGGGGVGAAAAAVAGAGSEEAGGLARAPPARVASGRPAGEAASTARGASADGPPPAASLIEPLDGTRGIVRCKSGAEARRGVSGKPLLSLAVTRAASRCSTLCRSAAHSCFEKTDCCSASRRLASMSRSSSSSVKGTLEAASHSSSSCASWANVSPLSSSHSALECSKPQLDGSSVPGSWLGGSSA
mmetsp:Transcript_34434/g.114975  ORF Transcript_34434/g.114975 Transcript_34434/m.114975 type:complete len:206 (-) Transcript_34434:593-1210(-)